VNSLYNQFPDWDNFKTQINLKSNHSIDRKTLVEVLRSQYQDIETSKATIENIDNLSNSNTFTITTGHQLNLFTGPVYFIYKIVSTIKLAKELSIKYPDFQFVPVYWMATEDHDFEEINHFYTSDNHKIQWKRETSGPVGKLTTNDLESIFDQLSETLDESEFSSELKKIFQKAYLKGHSLSKATQILVDYLFGKYGLVIIDAEQSALKQIYIPVIKQELEFQVFYKQVSATNEYLKENDWEVQVNPREINLFYLSENSRERIEKVGEEFQVKNTPLRFSKDEIFLELESHPEQFSPNVLMRLLYQETILPNLAYVGGGGEISYWLQLKGTFDYFKTPFPMLIVRNSVLWVTEKQHKKWEKLGLPKNDYLADFREITEKIIAQNEPDNKPDFNTLETQLRKDMAPLIDWAHNVDPTLVPGINATLQKQINEWQNWEHRLHKTLKKKNSEAIERAEKIYEELYPQGNLQERYLNFSVFYQKGNFIQRLIDELDQLKFEFEVFQI
jgi:bacillithiol biosynthesis cysteine-adding enzyme BshC